MSLKCIKLTLIRAKIKLKKKQSINEKRPNDGDSIELKIILLFGDGIYTKEAMYGIVIGLIS